MDPYTTAVSDTYQDLFGEGTFTGKGLYDVDAFAAALDGRVPDNTLLSHDLFEGLHARAALVTDVEVVDDYPSSVLAHARRQHRWTRGDWQILGWLFPFVPTRAGLARNRLPLIARWKILDNLRRSQLAPATLVLLLAAWTVLPGSPALWTAFVLAAIAFPLFPLALEAPAGPRAHQPWRAFLRGLREDARERLLRLLLQLAFLANQAYEMAHAIAGHRGPAGVHPASPAGVGDRRRQRRARGGREGRGGRARSSSRWRPARSSRRPDCCWSRPFVRARSWWPRPSSRSGASRPSSPMP